MLIIYGGCALLFTPLAKINTIFTLDIFYVSTLIFCALNTFIAYGAFAESLVHWQASRVGAVLALAPIITLVSGWLMSVIAPNIISPENISLVGVTGAFLVVIGSISIALSKFN